MPSHTAIGSNYTAIQTPDRETESVMVAVNTNCAEGHTGTEWGDREFPGLEKWYINKSVTPSGGNLEKSVTRHSVWHITCTETQKFTEIHKMTYTLTRKFYIQGYNSACSEINTNTSLNFSKHSSRSKVDSKEGKQVIQRTIYYLDSGHTDLCREKKVCICLGEAKYIKPF